MIGKVPAHLAALAVMKNGQCHKALLIYLDQNCQQSHRNLINNCAMTLFVIWAYQNDNQLCLHRD